VPSRVELHELMNELRTAGTTILMATHDMAEAEKMADRVAILLRGKIAATGTPRELTAAGSALTKVTISTSKKSLLVPELTLPGIQRQFMQDEYLICLSSDIGRTLQAILIHIEQHDDTITDLRVERPSLEERFLEITTEEVK
jgi:ABC-2 type transport system ATP-binding protein